MEAHRCSRSKELIWVSGKTELVPQSGNARQGKDRNMTNDVRIRILTVEDHPLLREGIAAIINSQPDMLLVGEASNGKEAIEKFREVRPDIALMDLRLPDLSGIETTIAIRTEFAGARVVILTTSACDVEIQRALKAGARGYLLKSMPAQEILSTIRQVHAGKRCVSPEIAAGLAEHLTDEALSEREAEVLRCVAEGNRNQDIAERLFIAVETVKVHMKHILGKLGAHDRTQAVAIAVRRGIIHL
jgi:DNA-binding NarL/FixJ family response regulator